MTPLEGECSSVQPPAGSLVPAMYQAVVQQLTGVVETVPHIAEHYTEGLCDGDGVPEVSIVFALALLSQQVAVLGLLGEHLLSQSLRAPTPHLSCTALQLHSKAECNR